MPKITQIDRDTCRRIRAAVVAALAPVEAEFGLKLVANGGGKFGDSHVEFPVRFDVVDAAGASVHAREHFELYAVAYDLKPSDYEAEFRVGTKTARLIGIAPKRRTYPYRVEIDGKVRLYGASILPAIRAARKVAS